MSNEKLKSDHIVIENKKYEIISKLRKESQLKHKEDAASDIDKLVFKEDDMIGSLLKKKEEIFAKREKIQFDKLYVPINKGHFDLDTENRRKEFEKKLSEGWEKDYKEYRSLWAELGKTKKVRDYPLLVDLELSSVCNLHCPMCYTISEDYIKRVSMKYMDHNVFKKVIDEIAGKVFAIRLSLRGESTLSKNFIDSIKYAKSKGILEVSTLTHGKKLTGDYLKQIVDAGIDWITVSVDGMHEDYNKIRHPLTWEGTLSRLKEIKELKATLGKSRPVIKVQGIWPSIRPYPTEFYEALLPYTDLIAYNPLIDYLDNDQDIEYEDNFSCPQLWQRMVINSDNSVVMCSNDEKQDSMIGNVKFQTVKEIWHGERLNFIRKLHEYKDGYKCLHPCKACYYPRKTDDSEKAKVGQREITIENYTNRSQIVGK